LLHQWFQAVTSLDYQPVQELGVLGGGCVVGQVNQFFYHVPIHGFVLVGPGRAAAAHRFAELSKGGQQVAVKGAAVGYRHGSQGKGAARAHGQAVAAVDANLFRPLHWFRQAFSALPGDDAHGADGGAGAAAFAFLVVDNKEAHDFPLCIRFLVGLIPARRICALRRRIRGLLYTQL
jgi:hypothetical protein